MVKTMMNMMKQYKEKFVVPKGVQDAIPISTIYDDGIFKIGKDKYFKTFKFTDIFLFKNTLIKTFIIVFY